MKSQNITNYGCWVDFVLICPCPNSCSGERSLNGTDKHTHTHTHTHKESFYHTLPLVSSKESEWVGLTFSDTLNTWGLLMHMLMSLFVCGRVRRKEKQRGAEIERTEFSPVVQLSAPIRIKLKAAESWCHGWPLQDQTCHFSYRSVQEEAQTHTSTAGYIPPFSILPSMSHLLACIPIRVHLFQSRKALGSFLWITKDK